MCKLSLVLILSHETLGWLLTWISLLFQFKAVSSFVLKEPEQVSPFHWAWLTLWHPPIERLLGPVASSFTSTTNALMNIVVHVPLHTCLRGAELLGQAHSPCSHSLRSRFAPKHTLYSLGPSAGRSPCQVLGWLCLNQRSSVWEPWEGVS